MSSTKKDEAWHWKIGRIPAIIHVIALIMGALPESPRWLYREGRKEEAVETLHKIRFPCEVSKEMKIMKSAMEAEIAKQGRIADYEKLYRTTDPLRLFSRRYADLKANLPYRRIIAGVGCLVAQQFVGMNIIMHYCYTIFHLVGAGEYISENDAEVAEKAALAIPLVTSVLSIIGTIFCTALVDRLGRRRLLLISVSGIMTSLGLLSYVFSVGVRGHDLSNEEGYQFLDYWHWWH
ncbi:probable inositol transporter 2 [Papaver somniferum]|uniref:probable inositol transporter 2 n=1 Tax=Papaver somniferum TaxID=3469 RepID=UPI000E70025C|nr:probable inositol transporter 2 [Papaver somniferum]